MYWRFRCFLFGDANVNVNQMLYIFFDNINKRIDKSSMIATYLVCNLLLVFVKIEHVLEFLKNISRIMHILLWAHTNILSYMHNQASFI